MFFPLALHSAPAPERPNIVFIFSDDHARQAISAYGSKLLKTPGIDALAEHGTRFDRFYTTNPLCAPSRATLLTGKFSHINGHKDNASRFDGSQQNFAKLLQASGYQTAFIGKWHLESNPTGFNYWDILPGQGAYYNPEFITAKGRNREAGYVTEITTKKAIDWMRQTQGKPFCVIVGQKAPHRNWMPGPKQLNLFPEYNFPEPPTLRTSYATLTSAAKRVTMRLDRDLRPAQDLMVDFTPPALTPEQQVPWKAAFARYDAQYKAALESSGDLLGTNYQRYLQSYLRCVAGVDESVAEITRFLKDAGLDRNTIIVYSSDQGFFLGENAWYDKRWFYEPSAGTPLIVKLPGQTEALTVDVPTSNVDFAPTLLEWAGVQVPADIQGRSLAELASTGKERKARPVVYGHFYESNDGDHKAPKYVAACTSRYKIAFYYEMGEWELFDLASDPNEASNRWSDPSLRGVRSEMVRKLLTRQREVREEPEIIDATRQGAPKG